MRIEDGFLGIPFAVVDADWAPKDEVWLVRLDRVDKWFNIKPVESPKPKIGDWPWPDA